MRVPLNWLKELVTLPTDVADLADKLTMSGHMLDKKEVKNGETVLDLELRGNRADCYSMIGIAREVSAIYGNRMKTQPLIQTVVVKKLKNTTLNIKTPLVKRVGMIEIENVVITKSPKWLREKLAAYGMESVNNIVDLTNYIMIEMGEPMHAFDLDKVKGNLEIRLAKKGEKIDTFQGSTLTLSNEDLVWAKGDTILSVAGAIGEAYHSISETTKNILLEAANYERSNIRRTVYRHKLFTQAGIRHEKDLDPNMVTPAIERFLYLVKKYNWGDFESKVFDYYPKKVKPWKIQLDRAQLDNLTGTHIDKKEINQILKKLNFGNLDNIIIPTYRTDVTLPEDVIEEIIRIYGYDKIPINTLSLPIPKNITPNYIKQEERLRMAATALGFDEIISLSFIPEKYVTTNIALENPPSPENKYLRVSLLPNLYESAKKIMDERGEVAQLFELGKVYLPAARLPAGQGRQAGLEKRKLGFLYWKKDKMSFSNFKSLILAFFEKINLDGLDFKAEIFDEKLTNSYYLLNKNINIGFGGEYKNVYYLEIDLDSILDKETKYNIKLWPKYPPQIEDITLVIPDKTYIGEVVKTVKSLSQLINKFELTDIFEGAYTFRIEYENPNKTLTDKEVENLRNQILTKIKSKFGVIMKN